MSPTVFAAVGLHRAMGSLLRLNSIKLPKCANIFRTLRLCPVLLSWVLKVITLPDATQLDKTVLLSWVASGDVIEALYELSYRHTNGRAPAVRRLHASVLSFSRHAGTVLFLLLQSAYWPTGLLLSKSRLQSPRDRHKRIYCNVITCKLKTRHSRENGTLCTTAEWPTAHTSRWSILCCSDFFCTGSA